MRSISIMLSALFFTMLIISSCTPGTGVAETRYGKDDPSSRIVKEKDLTKREKIDGYRVRVAAVDTEDEALLVEKQVVEAVQEPVYIEFIVDKYMVYVGDCQNREEANILKDKITELGFDRVYSVPKKVYKKTPPLEMVSTEPGDQENEDTEEQKISDKFDQVIGYRVQIFAAREKSNAEKIKASASEQIEERIYLVLADDGLYKIQVGDFLSKIEADKVRDRIRQTTNYKDAFIQNTHVFYENKSLKGGYYVQVGAFSGMDSAREFVSSLNTRGYDNAKVEHIDDLYKVFVGGYNTENEAENIKNSLLNDGMEGVMIIKK